MEENFVTITKNGKLSNIDENNLRKNDIVVLQAGDIVPADLKLIEARELEIDEFEITGEIKPVDKKVDENDEILFMGSRVLKGTGKGIVITVGAQTEYGAILNQKWEQNHHYRFQIINKNTICFSLLLLPVLIIHLITSNISLLFIIFYLLYSMVFILLQNDDLIKYRLISKGQKKCDDLKIQIRDVRVLEILNNIDTVCFDKTGVLTTRQFDIKKIYFADKIIDTNSDFYTVEKKTDYLVKLACALCNDVLYFEKFDSANPIDKALIIFAQKHGMDVKELLSQIKRIYDKPFNSENRYMAVGFETNDKEIYYLAKGDPDVILRMCNSYLTSNGNKKNMDSRFWLFNKLNFDTINQNKDTVIALAYSSDNPNQNPSGYMFLCMLQLENKLQQGAREIIEQLSKNGIRSILLTGDKAETALRVGTDCGITEKLSACLTGRMIDRMELSEVAKQSSYCSVFARLLPSQKGTIIRLLQQKGHYVAMVGDGPNDGIALKVADIGISFAKDSSPIARRLAKILINNLDDLLKLFECASRFRKGYNRLRILRTIVLVVSLLSIYAWILEYIVG